MEPGATTPRDGAIADSPPAAGGGSSGSVNLRRACSLSDLNKPNVARRVLPSPPNNGRTSWQQPTIKDNLNWLGSC